MKWMILVCLVSMSGYAQVRYADMKISQNSYPDVSIKATTLVTKVFLKRADDGLWQKVYEAEVAALKSTEIKDIKKRERRKAREEGERLMLLAETPKPATRDTMPEPVLVR
ncbi:MAG TPA: hypothetical protein VK183_14435 [Flavobacterium sp.]|nr:hypothetical protein [Flavobacterium sp.]